MPKRAPAQPKTSTPPPGSAELESRLALLEAVVGGINGLQGAVDDLREQQVKTRTIALEAHAHATDALTTSSSYAEKIGTLSLAVAHGIQHVDRAERRISATVRRAREQLAEHGLVSPGLEAESRDLQELDGEPGESGGVPPVPAHMEPTAPPPEDRLVANLRALKLSR